MGKLTVIFFLLASFVFGGELDSLERKIDQAETPSQKLDAIYSLTKLYGRRDYNITDSLFLIFEEVYLEMGGENAYTGKYYNLKGSYMVHQGKNTEAIDVYKKAEAPLIEQEDYGNLWNLYNNIGSTYDDLGQMSQALEFYLKSLEVAEEHVGEGAAAGTAINIGVVYAKQEMYDEALKYFKLSASYHRKGGDSWGLGNNLNNIGQVYSLSEQYDSAAVYFEKALVVWRKLEDNKGIAMTLHNLGSLKVKMKEFEEGQSYLEESLALCYKMGEEYGITLNLSSLGEVYQSTNQFDKAIEKVKEAITYSRENQLTDLQKMQQFQLYLYFKDHGDLADALHHHELYFELYDSLNNAEADKNLKEIQTKFETEKKQLELEKKDLALSESKLREEQSQNELAAKKRVQYVLFGGLFIVLVFAVVVFNRFKVTQKQKGIIEEQKGIVDLAYTELEEKNQEILDSISYAKRIQTAILPPNKIVKEYLSESFIWYQPKDIVAGDFYWLEHKDGKVLFAAADCTGHGVPGAMVSVVCVNGLNRSVREHGLTDPGKILDKTRELVIQEFEKSEEEVKDGMDIALCSLDGNTLEYAGANNPLWIIRKGAEEIEEVKANKEPIGKFITSSSYNTFQTTLNPGDTIYVFSDGYADQFGGEKGKKLKGANFKKLLLSIQNHSMEEQRNYIEEFFFNWKGEFEQIDDVCVIGVRV